VLPGKSTLPVLTNVLLEADPGDGLRLVATNLDLTVSRRLRATVSTAGRTTVPARLLADYVALLDRGKQVSLDLMSSGHKLHLACDRYEANISTLPADDFPTRQLSMARSALRSPVLCSRRPSFRWCSPLRPMTPGRFWREFCCDSTPAS
jgi:DNA polymerase-3 subunit beta